MTAAEAGQPDPLSYDELRARRAMIWLREEDVLHMLRRGDQGYRLHTLHADIERQGVALVVTHPDLAPVHPWSQPPALDLQAVYGVERRVINEEDGTAAVWELSTLTVEDAAAARLADVAATELRAVAGFTLGYNPDWLTCPEPGCPDPTVSVSGDVRDERTLSELLHLALQHRERYHRASTPPGAPG